MVTTGGVVDLDARSQTDVRDAVAAVEAADVPVAAHQFRGLRDPHLRRVVAGELEQVGRTLISSDDGFIAGYDDTAASAAVAAGLQTLSRNDRAVLAAVLLLTVAVPRASGEIESRDWTDAVPVASDKLRSTMKLSDTAIRASLRRLREMGVLCRGRRAAIAPGPQFTRLTEQQSRRLWAELVAVADPDGLLATQLRADPSLLDLDDRNAEGVL